MTVNIITEYYYILPNVAIPNWQGQAYFALLLPTSIQINRCPRWANSNGFREAFETA